MYCLLHIPHLCFKVSTCNNDETLSNFIKIKHPRKEEKKKPRVRTKVQASEEPKRGKPHEKKSLTIETSTNRMKHIN
jgi:hypothetical protein